MSDYLRPMGPLARRLASVACFLAALVSTAGTAIAIAAVIQGKRPGDRAVGAFVAAAIVGSIAAACWFMAVQLWVGGPAYRVTDLPLWFIELFGAIFLALGVWVAVGTGSAWPLSVVGVAGAMLLVRWTVWRNRRADPQNYVVRPSRPPESKSEGITARSAGAPAGDTRLVRSPPTREASAAACPMLDLGTLYSPYLIFLRCDGKYSDRDLLDRFGLSTYRPTKGFDRHGRHVVLADDGRWTMIADDLYYTLWHMSTTRPALAALAESCDVFACSHGDCDDSFDFIYYRDSRPARSYVVVDPHFDGRGFIAEDVGEPLPGEAVALKQPSVTMIGRALAAALGITIDGTRHEFRVYAPPA